MPSVQKRNKLIRRLKRQGYLTQENVVKAMQQVPREEFVDCSQVSLSKVYSDRPLPIGHEQTISAPHMVAWQSSLLELEPEDKVLEIGTGLGYQAAILSRIVNKIITLELIPELATAAKDNLEQYSNVKVITEDGSWGYEPEAPYEKIVVTCAAPELPQPLKQQLKLGGLIVAPIGSKHSQQLKRFRKTETDFEEVNHGSVRFVPLQGNSSFKS